MESIVDNMQKYANYREQFGRLTKAINNSFYLEAIFIEYAIIEDRFESILRHSGKFNPEKHTSLNTKLKKVQDMQREKKGLTKKYIPEELTAQIFEWKESRNKLIHALMKQNLHTEDLAEVALGGRELAKTLSNKTKSYNNALKKAEDTLR